VAVVEVDARDGAGAWGRTGLVAGAIAAVGQLVQSVLFVLDATGVLGSAPPFRETGAGRDQDLATFYVAFFEHQHDIAWNIAIRDTLGPVSYVAMIVLAASLVRLRGRGRPGAAVWGLVFGVGALLVMLSDLVFLSQLGLWRFTGFTPVPPADIIATGRSSETVERISDYLGNAGQVTLAVALVGLAGLLTLRLRLLTLVVALGALVSVVAALTFSDVLYDVTAIALGVVLAPLALLGIGRSLTSPTREPAEPTTELRPAAGHLSAR
jgi:hypothetical protein